MLLGTSSTAGDTFEERARRVQEQLWNDLQHRSSGVEVLRELALVRRQCTRRHDADRLHGHPQPRVGGATRSPFVHELGEVVFSSVQTPQVWLDHQVAEERGGFIAHWDAVDALFPPGMMDDMFNAYCRLVRGLADDPATWKKDARRLIELPEEQIERWAELNATDAPLPAGTLPERFAAQAAQTPEGLALVSPRPQPDLRGAVAAGQLIGRWLRERGARPDALVAVVMEKGGSRSRQCWASTRRARPICPSTRACRGSAADYLLEHGEVELVLTQSWLDGSPRLA